MGRSTRTSILKRQRELRLAERASEKRARRHGKPIVERSEPHPGAPAAAGGSGTGESDAAEQAPAQPAGADEPEQP
jgi:hypothetical protein